MKVFIFLANTLILTSFNAYALDVTLRFEHLDKDKSGFLTRDELEPQPKLLSTFTVWDKNQDNQISLNEFKNHLTNNLN
jgi:Ca2+-binding EF-hand superfamily protein